MIHALDSDFAKEVIALLANIEQNKGGQNEMKEHSEIIINMENN